MEELMRPGGVTTQRKRKTVDASGEDEILDYEQYGETNGIDVDDAGGGFFPEPQGHEHSEAGGGFLPDSADPGTTHDEDVGGFMVEPDAKESGGGSVTDDENARGFLADIAVDEGGFLPKGNAEGCSFLPDVDAEHPSIGVRPRQQDGASRTEAAEAVELYDSLQEAQADPRSKTSAPDAEGEDVADVTIANTRVERNVPVHTEPDRSGEDDSDNGSLLSHDPEDDDAEPDWLESE